MALKSAVQRKIQQEKDDFARALHRDDPPPVSPAAPGSEAVHDEHLKNVHGPIGYVMELFKRFGADYCPAWAASLSFFSILSIAPILLCAVAVLGFLIQDPAEAAAKVQGILANLLPGGGASQSAQEQAALIVKQLNIAQSADTLRNTSGTAGIIGLLSLFWSAMQIFLSAMTPMNAAFRVKETRGFIKLRLVALGMLFGAGLLFLVSLIPSSGTQIINALHLPGVGELPTVLKFPLNVIVPAIGVAINAVMFTLIYRFLPSPNANITWKAARFGGIIVAVLWEIAKQAFALYLTRFGSAGYNKVYGSLGGLVGGVFWIYYTSMILLLGAEIANLYADAQEARRLKAANA